MKRWQAPLLALGVFTLAAIYLFASAPPPLPDAPAGQRIPAQKALVLLDAENAAIRALYTSEIVGEGGRQGLAFGQDWKRDGVAAGPLPALLLRETSNRLQMRVPGLGLFLGSDFPLVKENLFRGEQAAQFREVRKTLQPRFFFDAAQGRTTAMFPDRAAAEACVRCHNEHPDSPKKDWALHDVMGATTWSYAGRQISAETLVRMVAELRRAAVDAYGSYLQKVAQFPPNARPVIGDKWPRDGFYLPDQETFRQAVEARSSASTLAALFAAVEAPQPSTPIKQGDPR